MILVCDSCKKRINTNKETFFIYLPVQSFYCPGCFEEVKFINEREGIDEEKTQDETIEVKPGKKVVNPNPNYINDVKPQNY